MGSGAGLRGAAPPCGAARRHRADGQRRRGWRPALSFVAAAANGKMLRFRTAPEITSVLGGRPKADAESGQSREMEVVFRGVRFRTIRLARFGAAGALPYSAGASAQRSMSRS
jgi:hypothetical protein